MARYGQPGLLYLDSNGKPLSEGKLYFYESGTMTDKTTYSDSAETVAHTHPIVLDADGRAPDIFFSGEAKIVITDANDVQQDEADPVGASNTYEFFDLWSVTTTYSEGEIVRDSSDRYFISIANTNTGNTPISSPEQWMQLHFYSTYNDNYSYSMGDVCLENNQLYLSVVGTNTGFNPIGNSSRWRPLSHDLWNSHSTENADFDAESGRRYFTNTRQIGAFTATLPASPEVDDMIGFVDNVGSFAESNLTLGRNGNEIMDMSEDMILDINYASIMLVYTANRGWVLV